jgi:hypothetical protein
MNTSHESKGLRPYFSMDDLPVQLDYKNVAHSKYMAAGNRKALLTYYNIDMISGRDADFKSKTTVIDFIDFKNFSFFQKVRFIKDFWREEKRKGSAMILLPTMPLFDLGPFYANLFFPTGRYHNVRAFDFNNCLPEKINIETILFR